MVGEGGFEPPTPGPEAGDCFRVGRHPGTIAEVTRGTHVLLSENSDKCFRAIPMPPPTLIECAFSGSIRPSGWNLSGDRSLAELLRAHHRLPASVLLRSIVKGVQYFAGKEFQDDVTLVAARCAGL
jgi:hypothetical protein